MKKLLTVIILGAAFAAFAHNNEDHTGMQTGASATTATPGATASTTTQGPMLKDDGQIAKVLLTLNEGEIDAAQIAQRKAKNSEVKDLAKMMIRDHKANMKETKKVAKDNKIDPDKSDMSKMLMEDAKTANKTLKDSQKNDFDMAYLSQQVDMHEKALNTLNSVIPQASNPAFKSHLETTRDKVSQHLAHVRDLQMKLK